MSPRISVLTIIFLGVLALPTTPPVQAAEKGLERRGSNTKCWEGWYACATLRHFEKLRGLSRARKEPCIGLVYRALAFEDQLVAVNQRLRKIHGDAAKPLRKKQNEIAKKRNDLLEQYRRCDAPTVDEGEGTETAPGDEPTRLSPVEAKRKRAGLERLRKKKLDLARKEFKREIAALTNKYTRALKAQLTDMNECGTDEFCLNKSMARFDKNAATYSSQRRTMTLYYERLMEWIDNTHDETSLNRYDRGVVIGFPDLLERKAFGGTK